MGGCGRPVLVVGGAPRVAVDAVRSLLVTTTGATARHLSTALAGRAVVDLLLSEGLMPDLTARRYRDREDLDAVVRAWVGGHHDGVVVMTAAVNDYQVAGLECCRDGHWQALPPGAKLSSGAEEVVIRLRPAAKLIDQLPAWGHRGPLVACKYQEAEGVIAAAQVLCTRVGAAVVVANSICGRVQALVDADGVRPYPNRAALLEALVTRVESLVQTP